MMTFSLLDAAKGIRHDIRDAGDGIFSEGLLGPGFLIYPETGVIISPVSGVVTQVFGTGHIVILHMTEGPDLMIHIGFGDKAVRSGLSVHVVKGQNVHAGETLVTFDIDSAPDDRNATAVAVVFPEMKRLETIHEDVSGVTVCVP
jgi:phosphotransferase system IIA component